VDKEGFYREMAVVLQVDRSKINDALMLADSGWDSITQVSVLLVLDQFGAPGVPPDDLAKCQTVGDLVRLAERV
jgi:acyl carrier protein